MNPSRHLWVTGIAMGLVLCSGIACMALEIRAADNAVVEKNEVIDDDVVLIGGLARVEGKVKGNVVACAGRVEIAGPVEGSIIASGGSIDITERVGGSVVAGCFGNTSSSDRVERTLWTRREYAN